MTFAELVDKYQTAPAIPDEELYDMMVSFRDYLVAQYRAGVKLADQPYGQEIRRRTEQDLFWACRYFTWNTNPAGVDKPVVDNGITRETHGEVCDFFVKKDKSKKIRDQDVFKNRILLFPRGSLKTTVDIVDAVQWILNFPEIRILILTAADDLAYGVVSEIKGHFLIYEEPSWMNLFFPEFCVTDKTASKGSEGWFVCPVWAAKGLERKEPTVLAATVLEALAGLHFEVGKLDDAVSNTNSNTEELCKKLTNRVDLHRKMIMRWGYWDKIGTRYQEYDDYGTELARLERYKAKLSQIRPGLEGLIDDKTKTKVLVGRAVLIKKETEAALVAEGKELSYEEAGEDGCYILLPHLISFQEFLVDYDKNPLDTEGQLNQNPTPPFESDFTHQMMLQATVPALDLPELGPITLFWDLASKNKKQSDFSVCTAVLWDAVKGTGYLVDYTKQKYSPTELARAIVNSIRDHMPLKVGIEDVGFSSHIQYAINDIAFKMSRQDKNPRIFEIAQAIEWVPTKNNKDEKDNRIKSLHPEFVFGRMKFSASCPMLEELYVDFERFPHRKHDDGPDSLAYQLRYRPVGLAASAAGDVIHFSYRDKLLNWARRDIFEPDIQDYMKLPELVPVELKREEHNTTPDGLENILGSWWTG
jgi:phage terminase large subunit-like protein